VTLLIQGCWITATKKFVAAEVTSSNKLDLSYLHRTKASSLKEAVQEGLQQSLQDNDSILVTIELMASLINIDLCWHCSHFGRTVL
jgi:hypothetical protein